MLRPLLLSLALTASAQPVEHSIKTMQAQMKYDTAEIIASPGDELKITLENTDDLPHNLIICKPRHRHRRNGQRPDDRPRGGEAQLVAR